ncbi:MAG: carbohydrate kinase [Hyphomicrobiales bacterium]|nr:carbohydrate kinase [Hyphomicrobiales bacterium]
MIVCCGEALIDMIPVSPSDESGEFHPIAGGAVFNTAIALGRLNVPVGFFTGISTDKYGEQLSEELRNSRVDMSRVIVSDRPTMLAFVKLTNGQASYVFHDENTASISLTREHLPKASEVADAYFFGGISLISEPCATTYEALMAREHADNVIMLDPNIRPAFVSDEQKYRERLNRMLGYTDIAKVSDEDLDWISGQKPEEDAVADLIAKGVAIVIVTKGEKGASLYTGNTKIGATPPKTSVVDTVGAGDTFNAGFLFWLSRNNGLKKERLKVFSEEELQNALNLGVYISSCVVGKKGANPPWEHELDSRFLR